MDEQHINKLNQLLPQMSQEEKLLALYRSSVLQYEANIDEEDWNQSPGLEEDFVAAWVEIEDMTLALSAIKAIANSL